MNEELTAEEQEERVLEREMRYSSSLDAGEITEEMNEDGEMIRTLYRRRCERNFDADSENDNTVPASIKKILKAGVLKNFDKLADISECPEAAEKMYGEARVFLQNHLAPLELRERYEDMKETPEREAERIMSLYVGEFLGAPHTKNTMIGR